MLNSREAPAKAPNMQTVLNKLLYGLFAVLFCTVVACAICGIIWESDNKETTAYLQVLSREEPRVVLCACVCQFSVNKVSRQLDC